MIDKEKLIELTAAMEHKQWMAWAVDIIVKEDISEEILEKALDVAKRNYLRRQTS